MSKGTIHGSSPKDYTSGVEGAVEMLTTSKKVLPLVDTLQQPRCASIAGQRKLIARRPENHERILGKYSKQSLLFDLW